MLGNKCESNENNQEIQEQSNFSSYPSYFEFSDIEDYSESPSNSSDYFKDSYYTSHYTDDLNNGIFRSLLWKKPKSVKTINLKLFGITFSGKVEQYVELEQKYKFDYSIDGKYFVFAKDKMVEIFDCENGWIVRKLKYKKKPHQLSLSKDSNYLLVSFCNYIGENDDQKMRIKHYIYNLINYNRVLRDIFIIESIMNCELNTVEYNIREDKFYSFYFHRYQMLGKILNLQNGQLIKSIDFVEFPKELFQEDDFVDFYTFPINNNVFIVNMHYNIDDKQQNLGCFLYNGKGKVLQKLKNYIISEDLFGLEVDKEDSDYCTYRLSNIIKGKLIKKIDVNIYSKSRYRFFEKDFRLIRLKNDLIIITNLSECGFNTQTFYTVETKCFNFKIRRCFYKGIKQINAKGAFDSQKNDVIKFYQF